MFLLWIIPIILQVLCIVHLVKTGRSTIWIFIIIFIPIAGMAAYFIVEILPGLLKSPNTRQLGTTLAETIVPHRKIEALEEQLQFSDTVSNRLILGDEYLKCGLYAKAICQYKACLKGFHAKDPHILGSLGKAYTYHKNFDEAIIILRKLMEVTDSPLSQELRLLYAFSLEKSGQDDEAEQEYKLLATDSANLEGMYNYGTFLKERQREAEAQKIFEEIILLSKTIPSFTLKENRKWINLAKKERQE